ncbi:MAG TPA: hypothetical protein VKQ72_17635, partial [Aggregatilineales bacterium]|nr:hypothetical protein [Aggregatilineales bacterium]
AQPAPEPAAAAPAMSSEELMAMDPMAWLESLAARQGAKTEELTTAHNMDIPELPSDTVVDEPGYTPGYDTGKPAEPARAERPAIKPIEEAAPLPLAQPAPEPAAATPAMSSEELMAMDPMAWLESLAARQGAKTEELTTAHNMDIPELPSDTVVDEPGYTPGYDTGKPAEPEPARAERPAIKPIEETAPPPPSVQSAPEPATAAPAMSSEELMAMDPMAWLESLAARQGAKTEELTTAHDMNVPLPPADAVIDEPGYVDYDPFGGSGVGKPASSTGPLAEERPAAVPPPAPEPQPVGDVLGGMDALSWLDSLQAEQESEATAVTGGLDFADLMSSEAAQEAGQPQSGGMTVDEAEHVLGLDIPENTEAQPVDALGGMDPLQWLESLAAQQGADVSSIVGTPESSQAPRAEESTLDWLDNLARGQTGPLDALDFDALGLPQASSAGSPEPDTGNVDLSVGMSNDVNELQNWLLGLGETRPEDIGEGVSDEAGAAVPADLPDWLQASMPPLSGPTVQATPALDDQILEPVAPSDLPDWLRTSETPAVDLEQDLLKAMAESSAPSMSAIPEPEIQLSQAELDAFTKPTSPEQADSWAEALDEEYERKQAGDESVPDWYLEAVSRAEAVLPSATASERETPAASAPEAVAAPTLSDADMPDWLRETTGEAESTGAAQGDIPDWLRTLSPEAPAAAPVNRQAVAEEVPDWLAPSTPAPVPAEAPVTTARVEQVPPAVPKPAAPAPRQPAPAPAGRTVETLRVRTASAIGPEHHERLKQAREFVSGNQYTNSLQHYQFLIDSAQLLEETRGDLRQLVEQNPSDPKLRRLLGDTHMRLGDLQSALDTYRSALDQL